MSDKVLTVLEGMIGLGLLNDKYVPDVSLIEILYGVVGHNLYAIGLCTPACSSISKNTLENYRRIILPSSD